MLAWIDLSNRSHRVSAGDRRHNSSVS